MKYASTRDAGKLHTFEEALFSGYAPDGGLFVPVELPDLLGKEPQNRVLAEVWPALSYTDLATELLHPFVRGGEGEEDDDDGDGDEGIPKEDLRSLLAKCLEGFDNDEKIDDPVPVVPLVRRAKDGEDTDPNTDPNTDPTVDCYVAELFHGPTYCFKDLGMRATVFLLEYFASRRSTTASNPSPNEITRPQKKVVLTASTTGDTGPAAVKAVRDLDSPHLGIVVHYPEGQISDFQRKQMTTIQSDKVAVVSFAGGGDDMDRPIKNIMTSQQPEQQTNATSHRNDGNILVCGVNSYNIGRPLMQMVHFVWTYLRVVEQIEARTKRKIDRDRFRLDVVIPTGAMGNIAGCYMAKQIGVPFGKLCAGVNVNDVTHRAFSTGKIRKPKSDEPMQPSLSDAINIQLPYNLERLLFYLTNQNHRLVRTWYECLEGSSGTDDTNGGWIDLTTTTTTTTTTTRTANGDDETTTTTRSSWLAKLQTEFRSAKVTDDALCATIRNVLGAYGYWVDPHTGVAVSAAEQLGWIPSLSPSGTTAAAAAAQTAPPPPTTNAVAIMATASPCKFRDAMTAAVGPERWMDYELHHFPAKGKDLMDRDEQPPTRYQADPGKCLEENQLVWEAKTRELIAKVGR